MSELLALVALNLTGELGIRGAKALLERFGSPDAILSAPPGELERVKGIRKKVAANLRKIRSEGSAEKELQRAGKLGIKIIPFNGKDYPEGLKKLFDAPLLLYVLGEIGETDGLALAMVGARRASFYGKNQSESLAYGLAAAGFTIVSGAARGIDEYAHRGALKAGGRTIAVVGSGLCNLYPPENKELMEKIPASGALVSEFPLDFPPLAQNFPRRNRIISGLSLGVIVVEAAARSGAMITARWANEQGREVFAVPGRIDSPVSRGCHRLIKDGAKLVEDVDDVINELGSLIEGITFSDRESETGPARKIALNERETSIYEALSSEEMNIEEIISATGKPPQEVMAILSMLCMKRFVNKLPGQNYVKI
jgi:DNA processing protein